MAYPIEAVAVKTETALNNVLKNANEKGYLVRDIKFAVTADDKPRFLVIYEK